jgi:hypothetical protein
MSARLRSLFLIAAGALTCSVSFGQSLAIGAIGGMRATNDLTGEAATSVSGRYVLGPKLDIGLPFGLGFEVDALYRRQGSWEFPMLLKYKLPFPRIKPFLEAGYAPRVINGTVHYYTNGTTDDTDYPTSEGIVVGGGVQFGIGRLRLAPAVRYTHWNNTPVVVYFGNGPQSQSTQNQADILLGISWKLH